MDSRGLSLFERSASYLKNYLTLKRHCLKKETCSNSTHEKTTEIALSPGDMVDVYVKSNGQKKGKWRLSRQVPKFDSKSARVTLPSSRGKTMNAAIEDLRPDVPADRFASLVRESNDELDDVMQDIVHTLPDAVKNPCQSSSNSPTFIATQFEPDYSCEEVTEPIEDHSFPQLPHPSVGDLLEVYWPEEDKYYAGKVSTIDDGSHLIE